MPKVVLVARRLVVGFRASVAEELHARRPSWGAIGANGFCILTALSRAVFVEFPSRFREAAGEDQPLIWLPG